MKIIEDIVKNGKQEAHDVKERAKVSGPRFVQFLMVMVVIWWAIWFFTQ